MMYQILLITVAIYYEVHSRNIVVNENINFSNCLGKVARHILKNDMFEVDYEYLDSIQYVSDYEAYLQRLNVKILKHNSSSGYKNMFDMYRYDGKFLLLQEVAVDYYINPKKLLLEGWVRKRAKLVIVQLNGTDATLYTNINLENINVCSKHFYEKHSNFCSNPVVTNHCLSKKNLKRFCRVRVSWIRATPFVDEIEKNVNPGLLVSFLKLYAEVRGVEVIFQKDNTEYQDEFLNNGTIFKLSKGLLDGKFDAAVGPLFMNSTEIAPFSYGPLLFKDDYYYIVKKRERITSYKKLTIVFDSDVWKGFVITFLVVAISYFLLSLAIEAHGLDFTTAFFNVFSLSLSVGISVLPKSLSVRLIFIFYALYSLNIDSAYLGTLSGIFTNAPYDVMVDRVVQLLNRGNVINFNWLAERLCKVTFVGKRVFSSYSKRDRVISNASDEDLMRRVAYGNENTTLTLLSTIVSHPYETSLVEYLFTRTTQLSLFATFYVRNGSHLKDSLIFWSHEMFERGFFSKWMNDIIEQNRNGSFVVKDKKEAIPLKMQHFEEIFKILFMGYALATLALILEFFYAWIDRRFKVTEKIKFLFNLLKPPPMYQ